MKREELEKVTYGAYEFLKKPVMRTVGEKKVRIGWVVVPNVPKDCDAYALLCGMVDEDVFTNAQLATAAFGQGFDLECRRKLTGVYLAATTEEYDKKAAYNKYYKQAMEQPACKALLLPSEWNDYIVKFARELWLENDAASDTSGWNNDTTVNCWEL